MIKITILIALILSLGMIFVLIYSDTPYNVCATNSSNAQYEPSIGYPPEICISNLPNIGETAIVEVTYTNEGYGNVTDTEHNRSTDTFRTGWVISSGFEIIDSGGLQYEQKYFRGTDQIQYYIYIAFTPLDESESKTYRIEVRAVEEGSHYVGGLGYSESEAYIDMYIDDKKTMFYSEHRARYPEQYQPPVNVRSDNQNLPTYDDGGRNITVISNVQPTRAQFQEWFTSHYNAVTPKISIDKALDFIGLAGAHLNLNATDIREILTDGGYTDQEIDDVFSRHMVT